MKNLFSHLLFLSVFFTALFGASPSFAQRGTGVGNGGRGEETEFKYIASLLAQWIRTGALNLDLRLAIRKPDFTEILHRIDQTPVQFNEVELKVWNSPRACKNYSETVVPVAYIECDVLIWNKTPDADKLALVFHEYLGLTRDEVNDGDFSKYALSPQLLGISFREKEKSQIGEWIHQAGSGGPVQTQVAPKEIVEFAQKLLRKENTLSIHPNGAIELTGENAFNGRYLANGDYQIQMSASQNLQETQLGNEKLLVKYNSACGHDYKLTLIWNKDFGIKAIDTEKGCMYQSSSGPVITKKLILADGSIRISKDEKLGGTDPEPVKIFVDGTKYYNQYISRQLR